MRGVGSWILLPILTRLEQTFGAEETARRCAKFGEDLCDVLRETVKETNQFEKTARVRRCHGFNSCYTLIRLEVHKTYL